MQANDPTSAIESPVHVTLGVGTSGLQLYMNETDHRVLVLEPQWNEIELCKMIPGCTYKGREKRWTMPLTWGGLVQLQGFFGDHLTYSEELSTWAWEVYHQRIEPSRAARELTTFDVTTELDERLYPCQRAGVRFMRIAGSGLLGDDLGVGKTVQMLALLRAYDELGITVLPTVVVCPNSVKYHWRNRLGEWFPRATPYVIGGGTAASRKVLKVAKDDPTAVVIVNYESVRLFSRLAPYGSIKLKRCKECDPKFGDDIRSSQCHVHPKELNGWGFKFTIVDEAQHIGEPKSQVTRATWAVAHDPSVEFRWALSGTPDNLERLWSIMHCVQPAEYPAKSQWLERYALYAWNVFGGASIVGIRPDTREELFRILDPRFRRMLLSVVMPQLPPKVRETRVATLTPTMRRMYDELDTQLYTRLPDGGIYIVKNQLVAKGRLLQFAAGTIQVEKPDENDISTWKVNITEPSPKLDVMEEVIDELGEHTSFTVSCYNRDVAHMAAARLANRNVRHSLIMGGVHPAEITQACDDLKSGKIRAVVYTIDAGAEGIDLSGAGVMINVQRSWSLIKDLQNEGRELRPGAERHDVIRIVDIVCENTREEKQIERLQQKMQIFEEINRDKQRITAQLQAIADPTSQQELVIRLATQLNDLHVRQESLNVNEDLLLEEPE